MFDHPVKTVGGSPKLGFIGAHIVELPSIVPACNTEAVLVQRTSEPAGFIPACCKCLALSEVTP